MVWWALCILGGIIGAPVGAVAGIAVLYGYFKLRGVREHEGKRGLLAGTLGILAGAPLGFWGGFRLVAWLLGNAS